MRRAWRWFLVFFRPEPGAPGVCVVRQLMFACIPGPHIWVDGRCHFCGQERRP